MVTSVVPALSVSQTRLGGRRRASETGISGSLQAVSFKLHSSSLHVPPLRVFEWSRVGEL